jgi:hypothetical protein
MTDENIIGDLANVKSQLVSIKSLVQDISGGFKSWRAPSTAASGMGASGSNNSMAGALAAVSSVTGSASSMASMATGFIPGIAGAAISTGIRVGQAGINFGLAQLSANATGMPGVGDVLNRAATYYNAGISAGGVNRSVMEAATFGTMRGGITSNGSDAYTAQYLTGAGMAFSQDPNSTYQQSLRSVANAAKYLNMPNQQAVAAIENLTSGSTSASLMAQFGIRTSDPRTANPLTQGQIFEQLAQRLTAGHPKASLAITQKQLRQGYLGQIINDAFQDPAQQAMFAQYMIERSKGTKMDLSNNAAMNKLLGGSAAGGNANPLAGMYDLNSNQAQNASKVESDYISGMSSAIGKIKALNDEFANMSSILKVTNAYLQVLGSSAGFQGKLQQVQGTNNFIKDTANAVTGGSLAVAGAAALAGQFEVAVPALAVSGISALVSNLAPAANTANQMGNYLNPFTGNTGKVIGGPTSTIGGTTMPDNGLQGNYKHVVPTSGAVTAPFGATGGPWGKGVHHGTDYGVADGTSVVAAADGVVDSSTVGSGPYSYGKYVVLNHGNGYKTLYAHLSQANVYPGDKVTAGQQIAKSGHSGYVTGPHLHFEVQKDGAAVNPSAFMSGAIGINPKNAKSSSGTSSAITTDPHSINNIVPGVTQLDPTAFTAYVPAASSILSVGATGVSATSPSVGLSFASSNASSGGSDAGSGGPASTMTLGGFSGYGSGSSGSSGSPKVEINLSIANASESEARKFASLVKSYLEQDLQMSSMGRF